MGAFIVVYINVLITFAKEVFVHFFTFSMSLTWYINFYLCLSWDIFASSCSQSWMLLNCDQYVKGQNVKGQLGLLIVESSL